MSEKGSAWAEYLAAARRLDALQREAAAVEAAEAGAVEAARAELAPLRARLVMQAGRLRETAGRAGVPAPVPTPGPDDRHAAAHSLVGGPAATMSALRAARSAADAADAALTAVEDDQATGAVARNLLVYGPIAVVTTLIQVVFALLVDDRTRLFYAAACGLSLAATGWALGWLLVGLIFRGRPRTALLGALTVFIPPIVVMVALIVL